MMKLEKVIKGAGGNMEKARKEVRGKLDMYYDFNTAQIDLIENFIHKLYPEVEDYMMEWEDIADLFYHVINGKY